MYKLLSFFACLALASAGVIEVTPCEDGSLAPLEVRVSGCDQVPCIIPIGSTPIIEADGIASQELNDLLISIISIRPDGTITTVPLPDSDACNLIISPEGQTCPVPVGTPLTFATPVEVNPIFPPGQTNLEIRLFMQSTTLTCFTVDVELVQEE